MEQTVKLIVGSSKITTVIEKKADRLWLKFPYSKSLLPEIKAMAGAKWHGFDDKPVKQWSILDCTRNKFQLAYLQGLNPYAPWDKPILDIPTKRKVYIHQKGMFNAWMTVHYMIWAAEMGTGKTLAAIEGIEYVSPPSVWWVGPKSALAAVKLEFRKWQCSITPEFMTYEALVKRIKEWIPGEKPPVMVVFDESSRLKTWTAIRTQAAYHLVESIRETWGDNGYVLEMTGSPSPGSPSDWWSQCEIACPGYVCEGTVLKFTERLAIVESSENTTGGKYNRLVAWKNSDKLCNECGQEKTHTDHKITLVDGVSDNAMAHEFVPCVNEVEKLYRRLKGLVVAIFKKDCLDLPEKIYRQVICPPKPNTLNAARLIAASAQSAITTLTLLRELSDGFQYQEKPYNKPHDACLGKGCELCNNSGVVTLQERVTVEVPCPKEDALIELLDEHDDVGRIVIYAGFTGALDRIERVCQNFQWETIRVDGRGWKYSSDLINTPEDALLRFQNDKSSRVAFIGHPGSAGMGLTLTASPSIVYYSNDFNAESRIQSEDRIHRPGMDVNRGATIIDLIHLPSDLKVLKNLQAKRELQAMSLGELKDAFTHELESRT